MSDRAAWVTDANLVRLRDEWAKGTSTAAIGRLFGVSKNAIVSKAHRLELELRPSPILGEFVRKKKAAPAIPPPRKTLPPLASEQAVLPAPVVAPSSPFLMSAPPVRAPIVKPSSIPRAAIAPEEPLPMPRNPNGRYRPCCWVTQVSKGGKLAVFCEAVSLSGKPYCDEHSKRAFVRIRDRREDAGVPHALMGND